MPRERLQRSASWERMAAVGRAVAVVVMVAARVVADRVEVARAVGRVAEAKAAAAKPGSRARRATPRAAVEGTTRPKGDRA